MVNGILPLMFRGAIRQLAAARVQVDSLRTPKFLRESYNPKRSGLITLSFELIDRNGQFGSDRGF